MYKAVDFKTNRQIKQDSKKEITNVSISYNDGKQDLELPSITICPYYVKIEQNKNTTFEEYMEHGLNVTDFFESAMQYVYLPGGR